MELNRYRVPRALVFDADTGLTQFVGHATDAAIERITVEVRGYFALVALLGFEAANNTSASIRFYDENNTTIATATAPISRRGPTDSTNTFDPIAGGQQLFATCSLADLTTLPDYVEVWVTVHLTTQAVP